MHRDPHENSAIPFIVKDQNNSYTLTPQAEHFLSQLQGPLTIVTVAGLYRSGKSYLLNRVILNRPNGFGVGPTVNPCTKGLWLWAEAIRAPQGRTLLVIDTQGLGALDEESNHDMKIFSLAVLLSTNFIYNSVGSIDETALQTLSLALHLVGTLDRDSLSNRPSLLWVVRDFSLQLINERGQAITANDYLELALTTQHLKESQKIQLRNIITQAFSNRECFTLIKPLIDEQKLQALDRVPVEQLRPQFVSQTISLRKYILSSLKQMKLGGSAAINGKQYALMIKKYLNAMNAGQMPDLADTWTYIRAEKARAAFQTSRQSYNDRLRNRVCPRLPMPNHRLQQLLVVLRKETLEQFISSSYQEGVTQQLAQFISSCESELTRANQKENKNMLGDVLRRQFEPFQKKLLSDYYCDLNSYEQDLRLAFTKSIPEKFAERIDIPAHELQLFAEKRITEAAKIFERRAREESNRAKQIKTQAESTLQNELRKQARVIEQQRKKFQEQMLNNQRRIFTITSEKQRLEEALEQQRREESAEAQKSRKKAEENNGMVQSLKTELTRLSTANSELQRNVFALRKDLQKQRALSSQKEQYLGGKMQEQERRIQQISTEHERSVKMWQNEKRQLLMNNQYKLQNFSRENKELADQLQQQIHQYEHERFLKQKAEEEVSNLKNKHLEELQNYREKLTNSTRKDTRREDEQILNKLKQVSLALDKSNKENKELQFKYKQQNQQLKMSKSTFQKDLAIFTQKIQFQQIQITQLRSKNAELNDSYQRYLENAHTDSKSVEEMCTRKMNEMSNEHNRALKFLEDDHQRKLREVKRQINSILKQKEELQLQIALDKKKVSDREHELVQNIKRIERAYEEAMHRLNSAQMDQQSAARQKQIYYQHKIKQLESEMQALTERAANERQEQIRKTEQNLASLKNYADRERIQWEKRLDEQREKNQRKLKQMQDEWTTRIHQQKQPLEAMIQELTERISVIQAECNEQLQTLRCDYDIRLQKANNAAIEQRMELSKRIALMGQEAQMTRLSLQNQLDQRTKSYQQSIETLRRQMTFDCEQQVRTIRQSLESTEKKYETLQKSLRKAQQNNFLLMSELDKQKAVNRQKNEHSSKQRRDLEQRYKNQVQLQMKTLQEFKISYELEQRRLNTQIDKLSKRLSESEDTLARKQNEFEEKKKTYLTKIQYLQSKITKLKEYEADLMNKFSSTVNALNKNGKQLREKDFSDRLQSMKEDYHKKIQEKQQQVNQERKDKDDKLCRLQTQNKSLRDRLLLHQMRQSGKKNRNQENAQQINKYERKLMEMKQELDKYVQRYHQVKEQKDRLQSMLKMGKSRVSDYSERHSFISDAPVLDMSSNKALRENKSVLNFRPPTTSTIKKQQHRVMNVQDFTGIKKWQQHH